MNSDTDARQTADELVPTAPVKRSRNWLGWAIAVGILIACALFFDIEAMIDSIRNLHPIEVIIILVLYTLDRVLMALKWWLLLRVVDVKLTPLQVIKIYYQGSFSGVFMPSHVGGDLLRAYWVSNSSGIKHPVFASVVMERLIGMLSAANWAVLGGVIYFCIVHPSYWWAWIGLGCAAIIVGNGIFALSLHKKFHGLILTMLNRPGGSKITGLLHKFYTAYADFSDHKTVLLQNIGLTLIEHALQMATVVFVAHSLGIDALTITFFAATAVFLFLFRIPIAPDGWGVGELVAIALFVPIGVQAEAAFAMTFVGHILVTLALVPGFFFLFFGNDQLRPKQVSS